MRLYYLEMKRLIRTKSVWILMIAMVVLAAVMAYVPVTFIRAYKTDAGNVQAVTGVQAVKISKETRKDMEGEVTEEKIRQAIRVLNEMYQEYGSSFMEEVPADVYAEKIYPIMPVLNVIEQVLAPDGKNLYNMEAFDVKEEDAATFYEKYREEIQGLSQNPEIVKEMQKNAGLEPIGLRTDIDPFGESETIICDTSEFTWNAPYATFWLAMGPTSGWHNWMVTACAGSSIGQKTLARASQITAASAIDLLTQPDILEKAREEWRERMGGKQYECLLPKEHKPPIGINAATMDKYFPNRRKNI